MMRAVQRLIGAVQSGTWDDLHGLAERAEREVAAMRTRQAFALEVGHSGRATYSPAARAVFDQLLEAKRDELANELAMMIVEGATVHDGVHVMNPRDLHALMDSYRGVLGAMVR